MLPRPDLCHSQIRELRELDLQTEEAEELRTVIKRLRDDELAHLDTAREHDAAKVGGTACRL